MHRAPPIDTVGGSWDFDIIRRAYIRREDGAEVDEEAFRAGHRPDPVDATAVRSLAAENRRAMSQPKNEAQANFQRLKERYGA